MPAAPRRIKPGWILLAALAVYAVVVTVLLSGARAELREHRTLQAVGETPGSAASPGAAPDPAARTAGATGEGAEARADAGAGAGARAAGGDAPAAATDAPAGLWLPVAGASLPEDPAHLPGAPRPYRDGVSQGFDFYGGVVGVPIPMGTAVLAATDATVQRVDHEYAEPDAEAWEGLMVDVADGASEEELDRLRGRQVWLRDDEGRVHRYAHLASVPEDLSVGDRVHRGQVIGAAGNSGTDDGVRGANGGVRVHYELWEGDAFFGEGLEPAAVRSEAAALFTGP